MAELFGTLPSPAQTAAYFFLALFPLVLVHEFGHFALAKLNRIRVDEFGIGFPPRLAKLFTRGGTEYTINWLPLGGFVRLYGEDGLPASGSAAAAPADVEEAFSSKSKAARAAVLFAGPLANVVLAAAIFAVLAAVYGMTEPLPGGGGMVHVSQVIPDRPAAAAGFEVGDLIYAIDDRRLTEIPLDSVKHADRTDPERALLQLTDASTDKGMRLAVLRGLTFVEAAVPQAGMSTRPAGLPLLDAATVVEAPAGGDVQVGDLIVSPPPGSAAPMLVLRPAAPSTGAGAAASKGGYAQTLAVTPLRPSPDQPGQIGIGIEPLSHTERLTPWEAVVYGPRRTAEVTALMVGGLVGMLTLAVRPEIAGPVGIAVMGRQFGEQGLDTFLAFMALLSINLGIINLLPIPALDGGRLLFIAMEALRGRRVEPTREAVVHMIGFALVLGLMLVVTVWEVARLGAGTGAP